METYSNRKLATRHVIGALHTGARAADASAARLPSLLLMLTLLMTGCVVVPIPANRPDPSVRTNITPETVNHLGAGDVSRTDVLLQLGEPDEVSLEERQFRSEEHTSELQHLGISYAVFCLKKQRAAGQHEAEQAHQKCANGKRATLEHLEIHFFFNDTATTEIYTLSLHDALPI